MHNLLRADEACICYEHRATGESILIGEVNNICIRLSYNCDDIKIWIYIIKKIRKLLNLPLLIHSWCLHQRLWFTIIYWKDISSDMVIGHDIYIVIIIIMMVRKTCMVWWYPMIVLLVNYISVFYMRFTTNI